MTLDTYQHLASRAERLAGVLADAGLGPALGEARRVLADVAALLASPSAERVPPTNDQVYAAAMRVAELDAMASSLGLVGGRGPSRASAWAVAELAAWAEADAACRRLRLRLVARLAAGGVRPLRPLHAARPDDEPPHDDAAPVSIATGRWETALAFAVLWPGEAWSEAAQRGGAGLRGVRRPGVVAIDVSADAALHDETLRVDGDRAGGEALSRRLDQRLREEIANVGRVLAEAGAFGVLATARGRALHVASGRVAWHEARVIGDTRPTNAAEQGVLSHLARALGDADA